MKRLLIILMATAMTVGAVASAGATQPHPSGRTIHGMYGPNPAPVTGCNDVLGPWACMIVPIHPTERFVAVKVTDTHGLPVYFSLFIPGSGWFRDGCGQTRARLPVGYSGNLEIEVGVSRWVAQTKCPASGVKTTGTIRVTLSTAP